MFSDDSESECAVCYAAHDEEIHQATLRVHRWFCEQVTHRVEGDSFVAPDAAASSLLSGNPLSRPPSAA